MKLSGLANKKVIRWLCCLLLAGSLGLPFHSQTKTQEPFARVPAPLRERLIQRLKNLIEYQREKQWGKLYTLLSIASIQGESKEDFIKRNQHWYTEVVPDDLILDFHPRDTVAHESSANAGWWTVYGCAKLRKKGHTVELQATVDAYRERGDWYFSQVGVITPIDGNPEPCSP
jgi:hypothetical protein